MICLLKVQLPPIEKSKTTLPYPTQPNLTKPNPHYSNPYPYPHIPQHQPYPHLQQHLQRHYIPTLSNPYWNWNLPSDSTSHSATPSQTLTFINTQHHPPSSLPYPTPIPSENWPKRLTAETTRAETTHLLRPKRPTPKIGRNDPSRNDPAETTQGQNDLDSLVLRDTSRIFRPVFRDSSSHPSQVDDIYTGIKHYFLCINIFCLYVTTIFNPWVGFICAIKYSILLGHEGGFEDTLIEKSRDYHKHKSQPERREFQHLPRSQVDVNVSENHVWSLLLHKTFCEGLDGVYLLEIFCHNLYWLAIFNLKK